MRVGRSGRVVWALVVIGGVVNVCVMASPKSIGRSACATEENAKRPRATAARGARGSAESAERFLTSFGMTSFVFGDGRNEPQGPPSQNEGGEPARQDNSVPAQGYKIAGTVVNAVTGAALGRVKVTIADTRERMRRVETITSEGGHFEFAGLPAGKYSLQGARSGYLTSAYEQHEQYSTAIVTGAEFATEKLVLRLMPMAMIAGHVLDESGEPVRSARVQLFVEDHSGGLSRVVSTCGARAMIAGTLILGCYGRGRILCRRARSRGMRCILQRTTTLCSELPRRWMWRIRRRFMEELRRQRMRRRSS